MVRDHTDGSICRHGGGGDSITAVGDGGLGAVVGRAWKLSSLASSSPEFKTPLCGS